MLLSASHLKVVLISCISLGLFSVANGQANASNASPKTTQVETQTESYRAEGFASIRKMDWISANRSFDAALSISPNDAPSLYGKALAQFNLNDIAGSSSALDSLILILAGEKRDQSLLADSLVLSAVISSIQNRTSDAIGKLQHAIELIPQHFDAHLSLGRIYFGSGQIDSSILSFRKAVLIQPENIQARFFLATALERAENAAEALSEYRRILKANPENVEGNLGLGVLLVKIEGASSPEGLRALRSAVRLDPGSYEGQITLGKTLVKLDRAAEAVEHLRRAIELAPGNPEPHFQLSLAYRKLGKTADADAEADIVKRIHESRRGVSTLPK